MLEEEAHHVHLSKVTGDVQRCVAGLGHWINLEGGGPMMTLQTATLQKYVTMIKVQKYHEQLQILQQKIEEISHIPLS